jgi:hypothetical protein
MFITVYAYLLELYAVVGAEDAHQRALGACSGEQPAVWGHGEARKGGAVRA